jgi:DNA-binding MarR family transcriptional regulator
MTVSALEEALGYNIYRAGLLFRRELIHALADYRMTPEQWQVMMTLWHTGKPVNQSEIVQLLLKDKHTVSRIIQRLSRDGWIEKRA